MENEKKKFGFTLAEVIITLGVIGIVAALTIPVLNAKIQKKVLENKINVNYAKIQMSIKNMMATEGVDRLSETTAFQSIGKGHLCALTGMDYTINENYCQEFIKIMPHYIRGFSIQTFGSISQPYGGLTVTSRTNSFVGKKYVKTDYGDFVQYAFYGTPQTTSYDKVGFVGYIIWDSDGYNNGTPPYRQGVDVHGFNITDTGNLYPWWSTQDSLNTCGTPTCHYWKYNVVKCGTAGVDDTKKQNASGSACLARIKENNWKIDYSW